jgi:hypothetical protein
MDKSPAGQTTGQKIRRLGEAVLGVVAVIFGTQITSPIVSLIVLVFGWALLTALIWELNLFNARTKPRRAVINAILTVMLGAVLCVAYRVSRPAPSPPPLTRTELHEELQGLLPSPQTVSTPSIDPSPSPAIKRSSKRASRTAEQLRREQKAMRDLNLKDRPD